MGQIASHRQLRMSFLRRALVTVPLVLLLGIGSGVVAGSGYENAWFARLEKPAIMPAGGVFGIVWTILYILQGLALALVLQARGAPLRGLAVAAFVVQFLLNLAWSPLFFAAHRVDAAFWLVVAIAITAAVTALLFARIRPVAGLLMLPYLGWLLFAAVLNAEIGRLNPDSQRLAPAPATTQIPL